MKLTMDLNELEIRYLRLGEIVEGIGGRTFAGRCYDFESFLKYGALFAQALKDNDQMETMREHYPDLCALVSEAWSTND